MKIAKEEVERVARLSRLALSETELVRMQKDLAEIQTYMQTLEQLASSGAVKSGEPVNVVREDMIKPSFDRDGLLANAAVHRADSIVVPKTVE